MYPEAEAVSRMPKITSYYESSSRAEKGYVHIQPFTLGTAERLIIQRNEKKKRKAWLDRRECLQRQAIFDSQDSGLGR